MFDLAFDLQLFANDISNSTSSTVVTGTALADSITSYGDSVTIYGGEGDDTISHSGRYALVDGGAGSDLISVNTYYATSRSDTSHGATIIGGAGDDTISCYGIYPIGITVYSYGNLYRYSAGDGNDIIEGFTSADTLEISGSEYTTQSSGENLIVNVGNGKITLSGVSESAEINIRGSYDISDKLTAVDEVVTLSSGNTRERVQYAGNTKKIVKNFSAGSDSTSDVVVFTGGRYSSTQRDGSLVKINMTGGNYIQLQTDSTSGDDVILCSFDGTNTFGAKIGSSVTTALTYDSDAKYYILSQPGKLNVNSSGNNIWLNNSRGNFFSNINTIDANYSSGSNTLVGNSQSNYIQSGSNSSCYTGLWGGAGNVSDTLSGGQGNDLDIYTSGTDVFWYGKNDGDDVILNAASNDTVNLYNVSLSDVVSLSADSNSISLTFTGGSTLKVNAARYRHSSLWENSGYSGLTAASPVFQIANGSKWQWQSAGSSSSGSWRRV